MMRAFLYDAEGEDCETKLGDRLPQLSPQQLLWIDVEGRDAKNLRRIGEMLRFDPRVASELGSSRWSSTLKNYGEYFHLDVPTIDQEENKDKKLETPKALRLDFLVSEQWLVTVHQKDVPFLTEFREQDRGETLIGNLSPASLVASLLDWHLSGYLAAIERLENFVDLLDVRMLAGRSIQTSLLDQVVGGRRYVSSLRRTLAPQRSVFYGLSRPDFLLVAESNAAEHFKSLEHRFERALDTVEHGRDLVQGSFDLFTTRVAETTNVLIRRLTFLSLLLGTIGAVAGIFGMNFQTPYTSTGVVGFWLVIIALGILLITAIAVGRFRKWV